MELEFRQLLLLILAHVSVFVFCADVVSLEVLCFKNESSVRKCKRVDTFVKANVIGHGSSFILHVCLSRM